MTEVTGQGFLSADVLRALHKAVELFTDMGRLSMAAKNLRVGHLCRPARVAILKVLAYMPYLRISKLQEVGETLEKENKKADSIEFFRQVCLLRRSEHCLTRICERQSQHHLGSTTLLLNCLTVLSIQED